MVSIKSGAPGSQRWDEFRNGRQTLPSQYSQSEVSASELPCLSSDRTLSSLVPANATADEVLAHAPDGVLFANGPGDPMRVSATIATARALVGRVPLFGICMGHQVLGMACGARYFKLPFGHHGDNHPVRDLATGRVIITAQNHNYAIHEDSLKGLPLEVTYVNLYDGTVEGLRHKELPVASVQFHPEASPGPHDGLYILQNVIDSFRKQ